MAKHSEFSIIDRVRVLAVWKSKEYFMYFKQDIAMMKRIFQLSDQALIHMVNHLFQTEYTDKEMVLKEWSDQEPASVWLTVGCANRYVFQLRRLEGCLQICAEDRGCVFQYGSSAVNTVVQIREPQMIYFGRSKKENYSTTLEFPGNERITLPIRLITLAGCSAWELEESGLIPFLPFLFYCFVDESKEKNQESLQYFMIHDIVGALNLSFQKGDLTVYDVQKLKQLCRRMAWKLLAREPWMQNLEMQEVILETFETDLDLLERIQRLEFEKLRNK